MNPCSLPKKTILFTLEFGISKWNQLHGVCQMILPIFMITILLLGYLFARFFWNWRVEPWPINHFKLPEYQVHRGYWREGIQENTLESFREARRRGAEMVELDVQLSSDNIVVVFHDDDISRFSQQNTSVQNLTAQELKELVNAPTLVEVLKDSEGPKYFNVEIKSDYYKSNGLEKAVVQAVLNADASGKIIFSSFNPAVLKRLSILLPEVPRALLVTNERGDAAGVLHLRQMWFGGYARVHMVNLYHKMLTPFLVRRLSERKIPVAVWTVNDELRAEMLIKNHGVVSIISDKFPLC
jgi:glycerophosphoryl diester phosphodiesterase